MLIHPQFFTNSNNILIIISAGYQLDLITNIVKCNKDIDFYIHSQHLSLEDFLRHPLSREINCRLISQRDKAELIFKMDFFNAILSTECRSCTAHKYGLELLNMAKKRIPIFEIQHGLFQLGLSYSCLPSKHRLFADSFLPKTAADEVLSFYPLKEKHTLIGYPPFYNVKPDLVKHKSAYCLILTNLNWHTYEEQERVNFYLSLEKLIKEHSEKCFIWKFHPQEVLWFKQADYYSDLLSTLSHNNLILHHEDPVLSHVPTQNLIKFASKVITTPSTVLLDCQMLKKNTVIYECCSNQTLLDLLRSSSKNKQPATFHNFSELAKIFSLEQGLLTEYLYSFDNAAFRGAIESCLI